MSSEGRADPATATAAVRRGVLCGLTAYLAWGFFSLFFKTLSQIPPLEVVAHRIVIFVMEGSIYARCKSPCNWSGTRIIRMWRSGQPRMSPALFDTQPSSTNQSG
jgi:EamA domain-containing membrane protein RarD